MRSMLLAIGLLCSLPSSSAWAEELGAAAAAEAANQRGLEAYAEGRYPEAVEAMLEAYQHFPDPALLFNVARIYEAMDEPALALSTYERFVQDPEADPDTVRRALEALSTLRDEGRRRPNTPELKEIGSDAADSGATRAAPTEPEGGAATPMPSSEAAMSASAKTSPPSRRPSPAPFLLAGGGAAFLGVGVGFAITAGQSYARATDLESSYEERLAAQQSGPTQALTADVLAGVGAGMVAAGIVAALIETLRPRNSQVVVAPWGGPEGGGLLLGYTPTPPRNTGHSRWALGQ
ncbi:MAG TPA: hypothetical protein DIU15_11260 [Deltaproteobacteria bacterium]|nr:hypothetical protein [Deltaproteobacteria bacterium]